MSFPGGVAELRVYHFKTNYSELLSVKSQQAYTHINTVFRVCSVSTYCLRSEVMITNLPYTELLPEITVWVDNPVAS